MTAHWPMHIYREDALRRAWWLHAILVVVWGRSGDGCGLRWFGGIFGTVGDRRMSCGKIKTPKVPISAHRQIWTVRPSCGMSEQIAGKKDADRRGRPERRQKRQKTVNVTFCMAHKLAREDYVIGS